MSASKTRVPSAVFSEKEFDEYDSSSDDLTLFDRSDRKSVNLSDFEQMDAETPKRYVESLGRREGIPYRKMEYPFSGNPEYQQITIVNMKKRNVLLNVVLLGLVNLFQGIGFLVYFPDIIFLNVNNVTTQHVAVFLLLTTYLISTLTSFALVDVVGQKWAIFIGAVGTTLYTCARIFGSDSFIITASVFSGISQGLYVVSLYVYMYSLVSEYSQLSGYDLHTVFCIFTGFVNMWGQLVPLLSAMLRYIFLPSEGQKTFQDVHNTKECGLGFCWRDSIGVSIFETKIALLRTPSDMFTLQGLLGAFLICSLGGAFLAWSNTTDEPDINQLHNLPHSSKPGIKPRESKYQFNSQLLTEPIRCFCDKHHLSLVPLFMFLGCQEMLVYSVFAQTFLQCSADLAKSLLMASILSAGSTVFSMPIGALLAFVGKLRVILPTMCLHLVLIIAVIFMDSTNTKGYLIIAVFWGVCNGILQNATIVLCTTSYQEVTTSTEAVIAFSRACQGIGYVTVALLQLYACNRTILIYSLCLLGLAGFCYVVMEIRIRLDARAALQNSQQYVPLKAEATWLPHVNPVHVRMDRTESLFMATDINDNLDK